MVGSRNDSRERAPSEGAREGGQGRAGEVRKGLRTIMRMLSKAHLRGEDAGAEPEEEPEEERGPLALARQRTRTEGRRGVCGRGEEVT